MKRSLLAGVFLASLALAKTFTLEQVLSAPFPSELIAAPGGGKVAWLLNERGARNVWMAAAPDFKGVRLTNYTAGRRAGCGPTPLDPRRQGRDLRARRRPGIPRTPRPQPSGRSGRRRSIHLDRRSR